ncbi:MAG: 50S ribosomal protein P1 [Nanoarchaeota archaeon]|jgi:large subunit ribosomal protein L12|nr:50S ribosomal protein P1 [Nanoarchaeota archaeon]|tara:strand:- start:4417 stop:4722 length:306 start_codon:yes stop_codon:yes gene_type:complete
MEEVYAALLLHKAGKEINEGNVKKVLEATGVSVEETKVKALIASLDGVDIEAAIKEAAATPVAAAPSEGAVEGGEKKEEKKPEEEKKSTEEAAAGLGQLFG